MRVRRAVAVPVVALALGGGLALAGCGGSSDDTSGPASSTPASHQNAMKDDKSGAAMKDDHPGDAMKGDKAGDAMKDDHPGDAMKDEG